MSTKKQKRAFITGITGQDGSYLAEFLLSKGYAVFGLIRRSSNDPFVRIPRELRSKIKFIYGNLRDEGSVRQALTLAKPDEIYNLGAQSDVGVSFMCPEETNEINYHGVGRLVHAMMDIVPKAKLYQASTSEMFGSTRPPQSEKSPFKPVSPYGVAKLRAHEDFIVGYREKYKLFLASGILFNHESPRRGEHFVTRKITISMSRISIGLQESFTLGNLNAMRDWGYAKDYVEFMWRMLQEKAPMDYVIATGEMHTVRDFVKATGDALGMNIVFSGKGLNEVGVDKKTGKTILRIDPKFFRKNEVHELQGDASLAKKVLKWTPPTLFTELVKIMVKADLAKARKEL